MMGRLLALGAAAVAAVAATGAAVRAKRRSDKNASEPEMAPADQAAGSGTAAAPRDTSPHTPTTAAAPAGSHPGGDDLTSLKGVGAVSAERLGSIGVTTVAQIAAWTDEDIESVAARIKVSPERIRREDWVGQAGAALDG
jgi:predicted flap endonuclease-1-like 5' DNA nuclease